MILDRGMTLWYQIKHLSFCRFKVEKLGGNLNYPHVSIFLNQSNLYGVYKSCGGCWQGQSLTMGRAVARLVMYRPTLVSPHAAPTYSLIFLTNIHNISMHSLFISYTKILKQLDTKGGRACQLKLISALTSQLQM